MPHTLQVPHYDETEADTSEPLTPMAIGAESSIFVIWRVRPYRTLIGDAPASGKEKNVPSRSSSVRLAPHSPTLSSIVISGWIRG